MAYRKNTKREQPLINKNLLQVQAIESQGLIHDRTDTGMERRKPKANGSTRVQVTSHKEEYLWRW